MNAKRTIGFFLIFGALTLLFNQAKFEPPERVFSAETCHALPDKPLRSVEEPLDTEVLSVSVLDEKNKKVICRYQNVSRIRSMARAGQIYVPNCHTEREVLIDISDSHGNSLVLRSDIKNLKNEIGVLVDSQQFALKNRRPANCFQVAHLKRQ